MEHIALSCQVAYIRFVVVANENLETTILGIVKFQQLVYLPGKHVKVLLICITHPPPQQWETKQKMPCFHSSEGKQWPCVFCHKVFHRNRKRPLRLWQTDGAIVLSQQQHTGVICRKPLSLYANITLSDRIKQMICTDQRG